jgi:hypothetical protein
VRADADARALGQTMPDVSVAAGMLDGKMGKAMIYGPAQSHSMVFELPKDQNAVRGKGITEKAMVVAVPGGAVTYDTARFSIAGVWREKLVDTRDTHHTSYKGNHGPMPGGAPLYSDVGADGWRVGGASAPATAASVAFNGHYLHGEQVVLSYTVGGTRILESPGADATRAIFSRTFEISPADKALDCLVGRIPASKVMVTGSHASLVADGRTLHAAIQAEGAEPVFRKDDSGALWLSIPPSAKSQRVTLWYSFEQPIAVRDLPAVPDLSRLTKGGPRRWTQSLQTSIVRGKSIDGYAADEFLVPVPIRGAAGCGSRPSTSLPTVASRFQR